jgi:hypothetical protein
MQVLGDNPLIGGFVVALVASAVWMGVITRNTEDADHRQIGFTTGFGIGAALMLPWLVAAILPMGITTIVYLGFYYWVMRRGFRFDGAVAIATAFLHHLLVALSVLAYFVLSAFGGGMEQMATMVERS